MKSERNQNIEQVAGIISESGWEFDFASAAEFAEKQNAGDGWGFEARYGTEGIGSWTRVEGLTLSAEDLALAVRLSEEWQTGDMFQTAHQLREQAAA